MPGDEKEKKDALNEYTEKHEDSSRIYRELGEKLKQVSKDLEALKAIPRDQAAVEIRKIQAAVRFMKTEAQEKIMSNNKACKELEHKFLPKNQ